MARVGQPPANAGLAKCKADTEARYRGGEKLAAELVTPLAKESPTGLAKH